MALIELSPSYEWAVWSPLVGRFPGETGRRLQGGLRYGPQREDAGFLFVTSFGTFRKRHVRYSGHDRNKLWAFDKRSRPQALLNDAATHLNLI